MLRVAAFLFVLIIDQITKFVVVQDMKLGQSRTIIDGFFDVTLVHNRGVAFGMFSSLPAGTREIILTVISISAVCVVAYLALTEARHDRVAKLAIWSIIAGAIGNFIDRIQYGYVIDFLDFYVGNWHWPAFNIADSAISIGVVFLLVRMSMPGRVQSQEPLMGIRPAAQENAGGQ